MKKHLLSRPLSISIMAVLIFLISTVFSHHISAQKYFTAEKTFAVKLGTTKPLYETDPVQATNKEKLKSFKLNKPKVIPNFGGRRQLDVHNPDALPVGADPLFNMIQGRTPMNEILPVVNIEGISEANSGSTPPDVNGDMGKDFYVEIVNSTYFKVYDKAGVAVSGLISANSIWSQVQQTSAGDPILLYDQAVDRWLLTEFPSNNRVLVAISHTSDPRGSWDAYAFQTPRFPDFPKYGIWGDAYYLTDNESGSDFPIYAINRDDILAGADVARIQRLTVPKIFGVFFEVGQPVDWDGSVPPPAGSPGLVVKLNDDDWGNTNQDEILLHKIGINWDSAALSNIEVIAIPTSPYDTDGCQLENTGGFSCIPQPNNQGIDGAQWIITNRAQYRNFGTHESFVMCFMVDVTGEDVAGIRWIEFRKTPVEDWHIHQEGTVGSDDGIHRFMPSIGIDGRGNIGLAYSVSGFDKFPSLRYTGRYESDPLGTMTFEEYEFATGGGSQGFDRFGDYASMSVDPADDATFWFAGEYLSTDNQWTTKIVAFRAHRDTFDVFPITLTAPENNADLGDEAVSITVFNRGLNTVFDFPLGYQFNNGAWVMEAPGLDSLPIDESFDYTFNVPVNFPGPGVYALNIATFLDEDGNKRNDTLSFYVTKYGHHDVAIEYVVPADNGVVCDEEVFNTILIRNAGLDTVKEITFEVNVNGSGLQFQWSGSLAFGEETTYSFPVIVNQEGTHTITVNTGLVNGVPDEVMANNEIQWDIEANPEGHRLTLRFKTDNFPQESTWKLFDPENNVIASGGPYAEPQSIFLEEFCLDPEACYVMTVYDSYGDGMPAGNDGDFEIYDDEGNVIAELARPNFGQQSSSQFCLTNECMFELQVGVHHESAPGASDGLAIGEATNGLGIVEYSINGGFSFQVSNLFLNLLPGSYNMIARDNAGCSDTVRFDVISCSLQAIYTTVPAIGGDVGEIHIAVTGAIGPVSYSLQGGAFVSDSFFVMLEPGDYTVTVRDSAGCELIDTVTVSTMVGTSLLAGDFFIHIYPNPGKGIYQVEASLDVEDVFVNYTIHSSAGEPLLDGTIARYDEKYKGELSLKAYPPGQYYVVFRPGRQLAVSKIIKLE